MLITEIKKQSNGKNKIYLEDGTYFLLYHKEILKYQLEENQVLPDEIKQQIFDEVIYKRACKRALYLLASMPLTEYQLREKLIRNEYPLQIIDKAVQYVDKFHYIDDMRYAQSYVEYKRNSKSKQQIKQELLRKGVDLRLTESALEVISEEEQNDLIHRMIKKKGINPGQAAQKELQKLYEFLMRKGFDSETIRKHIFIKDEYI